MYYHSFVRTSNASQNNKTKEGKLHKQEIENQAKQISKERA